MLTNQEIESLLREEPITDEWPWRTKDEMVIENHWEKVVLEICQKLEMDHKSEFTHYGSGYASYVDTWLFREDEQFRFGKGNSYWGLVILFSRLSPYCVMGEGKKKWSEVGRSSYRPCFQFVDHFTQGILKDLAENAEKIIGSHGIRRLKKQDLETKLETGIEVPTILSPPPWRHFDSLFHWED